MLLPERGCTQSEIPTHPDKSRSDGQECTVLSWDALSTDLQWRHTFPDGDAFALQALQDVVLTPECDNHSHGHFQRQAILLESGRHHLHLRPGTSRKSLYYSNTHRAEKNIANINPRNPWFLARPGWDGPAW